MLLHGFTQTGRLWGRFGDLLGAERPLVAVDLPGHGGSSAVAAGDLWQAAALVAAAARELAEPPFDVCGYSLGGRVALHLALSRPAEVRHLVLLSATAGIVDDDARALRRARDDARAAALEADGDVAAFVDRWLAQPMWAGLAGRDAGVAERLRNTAAGLAASLRTAGTGTQAPLWDRLGELRLPTLLVTGATDIGFTRVAQQMRERLVHAVAAVVAGAGHAVHLEQPVRTARTVSGWLGSLERGPAGGA